MPASFWRTTLKLCVLASLIQLVACKQHPEYSYYDYPNSTIQGALLGGFAGTAIGIPTKSNPWLAWTGILGGAIAGSIADSDLVLFDSLYAAGINVIPQGQQITLILPSDCFFEVDSAYLKYEQYPTLLDIVTLLKKYTKVPITIEAYTDSVGDDEFNDDLAERQAQRIAAYFWSHGIPYRRMHVLGGGKQPTVATNGTPHGSAYNRRVEIVMKTFVRLG